MRTKICRAKTKNVLVNMPKITGPVSTKLNFMLKIVVHHDQCLFLAILSPMAQKIKFMLKLWLFTNEYHLVHVRAKKRASLPGAENHHILTLCVSRYYVLGIPHPPSGSVWG